MSTAQHLLITRFNIRHPGAGYTGAFAPGWLDGRMRLFEDYCLPTVHQQSCRDFRWKVFCDKETDLAVLERIRSASDLVDVVLHPRIGGLNIAGFVEPGTEIMISSRLDSDDALHVDFIAGVQQRLEEFAASGEEKLLHNFRKGFKLDAVGRRVFRCEMPNSPFLSLFERTDAATPPHGVMVGNHSKMHEQFPSVQDDALAGWLQVIHGGNVLNKIGRRDVEVRRSALRPEDFRIRLG
jgi:hypothetical protein